MHLIIAGCGKMAQALNAACEELNISHAPFNSAAPGVTSSVAVHFGSGRQLESLHGYCEEWQIPIIQGSTGQKLPEKIRTTIVDASNLALPVVYLMGLVKDMHTRFEAMGMLKCAVKESHQASKTSVPGTAVKFAEAVKLAKSSIFSIRDPITQTVLGVPEEHLTRHGYHWVTWTFPDLEVELCTRVHGLRPYALGAITVARALLAELSSVDNSLRKETVYPVTSIV